MGVSTHSRLSLGGSGTTAPLTPLFNTVKLLIFTSRLSAIAWISVMVADLPFLACLPSPER